MNTAVRQLAVSANAATGRVATSRSRWMLPVLLIATLAASIPTFAQSIVTFDVPGAVGGTYPMIILESGPIAGYYLDADGLEHGFLRGADGTITKFDVPGTGGTYGTNEAIRHLDEEAESGSPGHE